MFVGPSGSVVDVDTLDDLAGGGPDRSTKPV
jgi:hypothetical protein